MTVFDDFFLEGGSPGFADGKGKKAHFISIGPVHPGWTVVDGGGGGWSKVRNPR